jgi:hypothetical protein
VPFGEASPVARPKTTISVVPEEVGAPLDEEGEDVSPRAILMPWDVRCDPGTEGSSSKGMLRRMFVM